MSGYKGVETQSLSNDEPPTTLIWRFRFTGQSVFHSVRLGNLEDYLKQFPDNKLIEIQELHREVLR